MEGFNAELIWTAKRLGMTPDDLVKKSVAEYTAYFIYEMKLHNAELEHYEKIGKK